MLGTLLQSTLDTLIMVFFSSFFAVIFGLPLGIFLFITQRDSLLPMPKTNKVLGTIVNVVRSFPFIILIVLLLPLSRLLIGTSIGVGAAIISLSTAAIPFIARMFEGALGEINKGLIEAAISMGANKFTIVKMILLETLPSLIHVFVIAVISIIGYSAMAGAVGAGGLGDLAIRIGYQSNQPDVMLYTVLVIIAMVQIIQSIGDFITKRLRKYR
ncbi:methionine ABC transporter permease [Helicobacter mustelae]|uniref:Putative D-methionine transport system permease protein MetI n=1 Tax=Helicobacter mustelae (strain ATCC 43772 / CCUG 25715 / CIP 103759 / LMG 18044 / NCTC 12198 / R85-136P) TaxID=679897 RepID=D3UJG9_HELM1|nr:methionine ABC transporter permease [Helicobacter mustelae]CBG40645.1 putative D-methionine transport system permease protein MetI [Helicobacter mustelae 12198]SQH72143.1 D-methionine transport system permease MetI [Helicobacter mustelae]STP13288.1 D-methionine transport system permease MetI [Helicobacter mustelae]